MTARILYFGSRTWIDVPKGSTLALAQGRQRAGYLYRGPLARIMHERLEADALAHPEGVIVVEGEAVGADLMARSLADGPGFTIDPYPVDTAIDGPWPAAGHRRNARMVRDGKPTAARGFVSGKRGAPLSRGSAGMLEILRRLRVPTVVHREDGIDRPHCPCGSFTHSACRRAQLDLGALDTDDDAPPEVTFPDSETAALAAAFENAGRRR